MPYYSIISMGEYLPQIIPDEAWYDISRSCSELRVTPYGLVHTVLACTCGLSLSILVVIRCSVVAKTQIRYNTEERRTAKQTRFVIFY